MAGVEVAPLLGHSSSGNYSSVYPSAPPGNGSPPPSYEAANCFPPREKACDVCSYNIDISKKTNDYVVTCPRCNELTALGNPPRGKRYVRCTCNKLLQCVKTATTVACDRPGCGAELRVQEQAVARVQIQQPSRRSGEMTEPHGGRCYRFICCHCNSVSVLDTVPSSHFRCRHCGKRPLQAASSAFSFSLMHCGLEATGELHQQRVRDDVNSSLRTGHVCES